MQSTQKAALGLALMTGLGVAALAPAHAVTATFNFDLDTAKTTTFTDTVNGLSATFSSPGVTGGYTVGFAGFYAAPISGSMLFTTANPSSLTPLNILFSQPINTFSLNFATNDQFGSVQPNPVSFTAFSGGATGTQVGTGSATGTYPNGYNFPQGTLSFTSATLFNDIRLSTPSTGLVLDNIQVVTPSATVPEASSPVLVGLGLAALGLPALRARKRRRA